MINLDLYIILPVHMIKQVSYWYNSLFQLIKQINLFMTLGSSHFVHFIILLSLLSVDIDCIKRRNLNIVPQSIFAQNKPERISRRSKPSKPRPNQCVSCPQPTVIANCEQTEFFPEKGYTLCKACKKNFRPDLSRRTCLPVVNYCAYFSKINENFCAQCIDGYVLSQEDNICYRTVDKCLMFNYINDTCKKCVDGYGLSNNVCSPRLCISGEYRNSSGLCAQGNITNCLEYQSPSGDCEICKPTFTLTQNECLAEPTCPADTTISFWILKNGECVQVTAGCLYIMDDGCGACEQLYYLINGKCVPVISGSNSQIAGDPESNFNEQNGS